VARRILTLALVVYLAVVAWGTLGPNPGSQVNAVVRQVKSAEDVGNIMLFVPFGLLVPLRFDRLKWWTVPLGSALSGAIELTQLLVVTHRTAQWSDWVWNTTGAALGFALFVLGTWAWGLISRRPVEAAR
jgi:VanZ family protein